MYGKVGGGENYFESMKREKKLMTQAVGRRDGKKEKGKNALLYIYQLWEKKKKKGGGGRGGWFRAVPLAGKEIEGPDSLRGGGKKKKSHDYTLSQKKRKEREVYKGDRAMRGKSGSQKTDERGKKKKIQFGGVLILWEGGKGGPISLRRRKCWQCGKKKDSFIA